MWYMREKFLRNQNFRKNGLEGEAAAWKFPILAFSFSTETCKTKFWAILLLSCCWALMIPLWVDDKGLFPLLSCCWTLIWSLWSDNKGLVLLLSCCWVLMWSLWSDDKRLLILLFCCWALCPPLSSMFSCLYYLILTFLSVLILLCLGIRGGGGGVLYFFLFTTRLTTKEGTGVPGLCKRRAN